MRCLFLGFRVQGLGLFNLLRRRWENTKTSANPNPKPRILNHYPRRISVYIGVLSLYGFGSAGSKVKGADPLVG